MDRIKRLWDAIFIGMIALICCAVLATSALARIAVLKIAPSELLRGEQWIKPQTDIPGVYQLAHDFETLRVVISDFSKAWLPGYDRLLELNAHLIVEGNRRLYDAVFGEAYQYLPVTSI